MHIRGTYILYFYLGPTFSIYFFTNGILFIARFTGYIYKGYVINSEIA